MVTFREVQQALSEKTAEILSQIPVKLVQLSLPTDGAGVRIRASVLPQDRRRVPSSVKVQLDDRMVKIPLESAGDYEPMSAR